MLEEFAQVAIKERELSQASGPAPEDRHLAKAFQAGDASSYRVIHQRYRAEVETLCRRMLGNYHDAEEATQETFIRVFQALPRFNGQYRLRPWIAKIATNVCLDMLRARTRANRFQVNGNGHGNGNGNGHSNGNGNGYGHLSTEEWAEQHASGNGRSAEVLDPLEILERRTEDREVRAALDTLPDHYRMALLMREYEGFSHEEIGAVLGMSTSQVKALLHRAKKSFRKVWLQAATRSFGLLLPLFGWMRRFGRKAVEVSQPVAGGAAATTQTATTVVSQVAASPVGASLTERVVGVLAAVTVTGAIGVGAVTAVNHHHGAAKKPAPVVATAPPAPAPAVTTGGSAITPPPSLATVKGESLAPAPKVDKHPRATPGDTGTGSSTGTVTQTVGPPPDGDPSTEPTPGDSGTPTTDPSQTPGPTPSVVPPTIEVPPAPDWSGSFKLATEGGDLDVSGLKISSFNPTNVPGSDFRFSEQLSGSGDLTGVTWDLAATLSASAPGAGDSGSANLTFSLTGPDTTYHFDAHPILTLVKKADGIWTYQISGSWSSADLEASGDLNGFIAWWTDGTSAQPVESTLYLTQAS